MICYIEVPFIDSYLLYIELPFIDSDLLYIEVPFIDSDLLYIDRAPDNFQVQRVITPYF